MLQLQLSHSFFLSTKLYILSLVTSRIVGITIALISKKMIDSVPGDVLGGSCLTGQMVTILSLACFLLKLVAQLLLYT